MRRNSLDQIIIDEDDLIEIFYQGQSVSHLVVDRTDWIEQFNSECDEYGLDENIDYELESQEDPDIFVRKNLSNWHLPQEYMDFDIEDYLFNKCSNQKQTKRVQEELDEFKKRDMIIVLKWLKYFVDTMRSNRLIWGVGRGSSVSSYVLYLLEVHKVDSIEFGLDIREFLK